MGYWKSKVVPMFKRVFDKNAGKRTAAAEACKSFEGSKDSYNADFEEKKAELQPKVLEIYEGSSADIKAFVKERTDAVLKKNSTAVHSFLEQLAKIDFPGSQAACDASSNYGAAYVVEPILFVFEKVSTLVITEKKAGTEAPPPTKEEEETSGAEREIVVEEEKKEEKEEARKERVEEVTEKTEDTAKDEKEKPVEPAAAAQNQEEEKPAEPVAASTSSEPAKKTDEESASAPPTTEPAKV